MQCLRWSSADENQISLDIFEMNAAVLCEIAHNENNGHSLIFVKLNVNLNIDSRTLNLFHSMWRGWYLPRNYFLFKS